MSDPWALYKQMTEVEARLRSKMRYAKKRAALAESAGKGKTVATEMTRESGELVLTFTGEDAAALRAFAEKYHLTTDEMIAGDVGTVIAMVLDGRIVLKRGKR